MPSSCAARRPGTRASGNGGEKNLKSFMLDIIHMRASRRESDKKRVVVETKPKSVRPEELKRLLDQMREEDF